MTTIANKSIKLGVTLCVAFAVSGNVFAQAPVIDANGGSNLEQRIEILERIVKSRTQMQHRLQSQLDSMQSEIDQLRGAVEVNTNELEKVLERQRELYLEIDKRVEALKQNGSISGAVVTNEVSVPMNTSQGSLEGDNEAYDSAVNLIKSREYDKAESAFESFIDRFPQSKYAPNAHYWLGQLLYNKEQWDEANEQFSIVANRFPNSTKHPEALLKLGIIAQRKGDTATARDLYQQVISQYPDSSVKRLAESRLSQL